MARAIADEGFVRIALLLQSRDHREMALEIVEVDRLEDATVEDLRDFVETLAIFLLTGVAMATMLILPLLVVVDRTDIPSIVALPLCIALMWVPSYGFVLGILRHTIRAPAVSQRNVKALRLSPWQATALAGALGSALWVAF